LADGCRLVTGGSGFAGRHLVARLGAAGKETDAPSHAQLDLLDAEAVRRHVAHVAPARVFHLAARASVAGSWKAPAEVVCANQAMTLNLFEALRHEAADALVLLASSGEVYGAPEALPVTEDAAPRPRSPYAVSKLGCELAAELYRTVHGLRITCTRAFNHAGPGQSATYLVGSLTRQVAEAEARGDASVTLRTGNPDVARDFCDVRDVVKAYELAIEAPPGLYNVASGRAVSLAELIEAIGGATRLEIRHEVDPTLLRPDDPPRVAGSAERFERTTGWRPAIPLSETVADALAAWRHAFADG